MDKPFPFLDDSLLPPGGTRFPHDVLGATKDDLLAAFQGEFHYVVANGPTLYGDSDTANALAAMDYWAYLYQKRTDAPANGLAETILESYQARLPLAFGPDSPGDKSEIFLFDRFLAWKSRPI